MGLAYTGSMRKEISKEALGGVPLGCTESFVLGICLVAKNLGPLLS